MFRGSFSTIIAIVLVIKSEKNCSKTPPKILDERNGEPFLNFRNFLAVKKSLGATDLKNKYK